MRKITAGRAKMLFMAIFMATAILLQAVVCFADGGGAAGALFSVKAAESGKAFTLIREKDGVTKEYIDFDKDFHLKYKVECKGYPQVDSYDYEVIKTVEGMAVIPRGTAKVNVDISALIDEMNGVLDKYANIYLELSIADSDNNGAGISTDTICLQNTQKAMEMLQGMQGMEGQGQNQAPVQTVPEQAAPAARSYKGASSWAIAELDRAAQYGFITDKIKGNMAGAITREEFAELAVKLYEEYTGKTASCTDMSAFKDTQNPEVFKAYKLGIVNGTDMVKKLFSPNTPTNREQVAAMMYRLIKLIQPDADFSTVGAESFADARQISSWALEPVKFMNKNGFIKGTAGKFNPKGACTREAAVLIGLRAYEKYSAAGNGTSMSGQMLPKVNSGTALPADFPKDIPMLPFTEVTTIDGFSSDLDASITYLTDTSFDEAVKFYSNKANYKGFQSIVPGDDAGDTGKSFIVITGEYNILAVIAKDEGQVEIMLHVFGTTFSD